MAMAKLEQTEVAVTDF